MSCSSYLDGLWQGRQVLPRGLVQNNTQHPCEFPSNSFFKCFVQVQVVPPYSSTDLTTVWKNSHFILSGRSDFHTVDNLPIVVRAFPMQKMTSLSVDEILLPRYMNWSTGTIMIITFPKIKLTVEIIIALRIYRPIWETIYFARSSTSFE